MNRQAKLTQANAPHGLIGKVFGYVMAAMNGDMNCGAVKLLTVQPDDHVLEIGFGSGTTIRMIADRATRGFVAGVDVSEAMMAQARRRNRDDVRAGRVDLRHGSVSALPFEADRFDKVCAVNTIQFWPVLADDLAEVRRVMKGGGALVIAMRESTGLADEVARLLAVVGFRDVQMQHAHARTGEVVSLIAWKSAT